MAKVRVYELAKEFGVESKAVMDQLKEMGEFVRSASSTIEAPVVRRLKEAYGAQQPRSGNGQRRAQQAAPAQSAASAGPAPSAPPAVAAAQSDGKGSVNGSTQAAPAAQPVSGQQQEQPRGGLHQHARPLGVELLLAQAAAGDGQPGVRADGQGVRIRSRRGD